jgi:hypothetical protein
VSAPDLRFRTAALGAGLAVGLWVLAGLVDLRTPFELRIGGGVASWSVAGSTVSSEIPPAPAQRIVVAVPPTLPPGAAIEALVLTDSEQHRIRLRLPQRAPFSGRTLVGDWWVDSADQPEPAAALVLEDAAEVVVRGTVRGRWLEAVRLELHGPDLVATARRGLINNDIGLRSLDDITLASTSIDPHPLSHLGGTAATLLRALAVAALLVGLWRAVGGTPSTGRTERSTFPLIWVAVAAVLAGGSSLWMASVILERLPHQPDEVVYGLQAGWMADGRLTGDSPLCADHFQVPFTYHIGDRWIGHYPPGWPALLALAEPLAAEWAVAPLLRLPWVFALAALGWAVDGRRSAILAAALGATSPLATVLFASRMAHPAAATAIVVAIWLIWPRDPASPGRWRPLMAGVMLAAALSIRPLSAVVAAVAMGAFMIHEIRAGRRPWSDLWFAMGAGLLATVPTLLANAAVTGSPWRFAYSLAGAPMMGSDQIAFGLRNLDAILAGLNVQMLGWGWPWLTGPVAAGLALAPALLPFLLGRSRPGDGRMLAIAAALVLVHVGARASGLHGYGPRYAFEALGLLLVLSARGISELAALEGRRRPVALFLAAVLIAGAAIATPRRAALYRGYNHVDGTLRRAAADLPPCTLGLLPEDDWRVWAEVAPWLPPDPEGGPVLATGWIDDPDLGWCFPDHRPLVWNGAEFVPNEEALDP